jgi:diaminohydroxyphosphoribosylaminopyrimidine deaminase/5-amino-6-(5-phosphoribosylamino)uracil reductase
MAAALRLGRRNLGATSPNPAVGAIIVRSGDDGGAHVVGRGWTAPGGRPHAETMALAEAGEAARGATVYVTLEPCAHHGGTPPCAEALVAAGVGRVVSAITDPDPRVAGRGHAVLEAAGIAVTTGVMERQARLAHAGHISRVTKGRPWVTLKLAVSADGMIGRREGERMIISGRAAFDLVQAMRVESDAAMIGIGTVRSDDPRLTVRQPGLAARSPVRVILDSAAEIPLSSRLVETAREVPLWIVARDDAPADRVAALQAAGAEVISVRGGSGGTDLGEALSRLAERGITRVLAEGGAKVASTLVTQGLADEVILFRAPVVVGPDGVRALAGNALSAIERSPRYQTLDDIAVGDDRMRHYLRTG